MSDIHSLPILDPLDKRLNTFRSNLADATLFGLVKNQWRMLLKCRPPALIKSQ